MKKVASAAHLGVAATMTKMIKSPAAHLGVAARTTMKSCGMELTNFSLRPGGPTHIVEWEPDPRTIQPLHSGTKSRMMELENYKKWLQ